MKRIDTRIIVLMAVATLMFGCNRKPSKTKEQVMQERLAERIDRWKTDTEKKCRKDIDEKATALTDSIIIANAKQNRDTSIHQLIPGRPTRPDYVPPVDSAPVEPILK